MCLVAFASICLAPLLSSHWGAATYLKYKKTSKFLIISAERWAIAIPCEQSLHFSGGSRGGVRGAWAPLLFLDWGPKGRTKVFWSPPARLSKVLDDPPTPLSQGLDTALHFRSVSEVCIAELFARQLTPRKCVCSQGRRLVYKFLDNKVLLNSVLMYSLFTDVPPWSGLTRTQVGKILETPRVF